MAIDVSDLKGRTLDPEIAQELAVFEKTVGEYLADVSVSEIMRSNPTPATPMPRYKGRCAQCHIWNTMD